MTPEEWLKNRDDPPEEQVVYLVTVRNEDSYPISCRRCDRAWEASVDRFHTIFASRKEAEEFATHWGLCAGCSVRPYTVVQPCGEDCPCYDCAHDFKRPESCSCVECFDDEGGEDE